jgi:lipopolysaccharide export system permease protein
MRLSDRYIGRQILIGTVFAILLLSTILVMGSLFQNIKTLIVDFGAPLSMIGEFILATIPFSLIYTIPWAFLSAVLLVFGRMSSDNELIGFRVAGMSLKRLAMPVFVIGLGLSAMCLWLNLEISPKAKRQVDNIKIRAFMKDPKSILRAAAEKDGLERLEKSAGNVRAYIEKSDGDVMHGMHLFQVPDPGDKSGRRLIYVHAMRAEPKIENKEFRFHLYDAMFETVDETGAPKIVMAKESVPVVLPFTEAPTKPDPSSMSNGEIRASIDAFYDNFPKARGREEVKKKYVANCEAEIQRRYASSFACLAFAFIGVPLGIKARRKDTSTGLIISLVIGAAYFICGMIGGKSPDGIVVANWAPNVICVLIGLYLLRRARFR